MEYLQFILGLVVLVFSGKYLVEGGSCVAKHFKLSPLVVGITVVAFGTSAPELIVSVNAAFTGNPEIAIGNVIGSNIANIGLVLALTAIIIPIPVNRASVFKDWPVMMLASIAFYVFILNNLLEWWEGLIFVSFLTAFLIYTIKKSKTTELDQPKIPEKEKSLFIAITLVVVSSVGLAVGAHFLVSGASEIALSWGVSKRIISITIVAFGTSVPELTASIIAAFKKQTDISIGNIIGSNIFNILAVLGITSMIKEIPVNFADFHSDILWMLGISILLFIFIFPFKTGYLRRSESILLFGVYIAYIGQLILF